MNFFKESIGTEKGPEKKEFGRNIKAILEFKRHQVPGKTPEGMSADFLTEEGKSEAMKDGLEITEGNVKAYSSPKLRAQETADIMLDNIDDSSNIINKYSSSFNEMAKGQREGNKFIVRTKKELDTVDNFSKVMSIASEWAEKQIKEGSVLDKYSLIVQWYLDNPEICKMNNVLTAHESAAEIGERAAIELGMSERFYDGSDVRLINVTHGPKIEPFLQEIIGMKNVEEIGGALAPGESIKFSVAINGDKKKEVKLLFRDKEYPVDEGIINKLSQEYRKRMRQNK